MTSFLEQQIQPLTPELLAMLEARGLEAEAMLRLDLGIGASTKDSGALAVPFFDGGRIVCSNLEPQNNGLDLASLSIIAAVQHRRRPRAGVGLAAADCGR